MPKLIPQSNMAFKNIFKKNTPEKKQTEITSAISSVPPATGADREPDEKRGEQFSSVDKKSSLDQSLAYEALVSLYLTEKTSALSALNQYVFKVFKTANKIQIKKAVEELYRVKVEGVKILVMPSKKRTLGQREGIKPGFKKAVVKLKAGDKIDIAA